MLSKAVTTVVALLLPLAVFASPITFDFTVTATTGTLAGDVANGSFTYDSSSVPLANHGYPETGLFTALSFTWNGATFNSTTANTGGIHTGAVAGQLLNTVFGDGGCDVVPGSGSCSINPSDTNDWVIGISNFGLPNQGSYFDYTVGNGSSLFTGAVTNIAEAGAVPLPSTAWLLLGALGVLGALGRTHRATPNLCAALGGRAVT
jgi:hypothetical protein